MTGYHSKRRRASRALSVAVGLAGGLVGLLLLPLPVRADDAGAIEPEPLEWARVDYLRNRVQLLPENDQARRAQISDMLGIGDSLRTLRRARAELRFNDDSLARIGERATFRFTPNTRNFQLTNGTALLLIPPARGRSTIQTPNAVTGIQGSALFVRYIPETDTTIVGALTNNPNGPMVVFNRDGSEQQALRANEIGVIQGNRITQLYRFESEVFWQSSGLAEGFDYLEDSPEGGTDPLNPVRQEIRDAIANQEPLPSNGGVIENPPSFRRPDSPESAPSNGSQGTPGTPRPSAPGSSGSGSSGSSGTGTSSTGSGTSSSGTTGESPISSGTANGGSSGGSSSGGGGTTPIGSGISGAANGTSTNSSADDTISTPSTPPTSSTTPTIEKQRPTNITRRPLS